VSTVCRPTGVVRSKVLVATVKALDQAVAPRRQARAQQSGDDAQAQQLTFAPYLRAWLVRQMAGGWLHDLQEGMARDWRLLDAAATQGQRRTCRKPKCCSSS